MKKLGVFLFGAVFGVALVPLVSLAGGAFYVDSSTGYVGIGNTTPASPLDVLGAMYSELVTDSDASSMTIDWNAGNEHVITLNTSNTTFTAFNNGKAGGKYDLIVSQDATGGRTITWPASVKWTGGSVPSSATSASSTNVFSFLYNGSDYLGSLTYRSTAPQQIAFDAGHSQVQVSCDGSSHTWTHTPTGTPSLVIVSGYQTASTCITSMTYGGQTMTQISTPTGNSTAGYAVAYYLANPPSGAQTVQVNTTNNSNFVHLASNTYTGTQTTSAAIANINTTANTVSSQTTETISLTAGSPGSWLGVAAQTDVSDASGVTGGGTTWANRSDSPVYKATDSNGIVTSGSDTVTFSYGSNQNAFGAIGFEIVAGN